MSIAHEPPRPASPPTAASVSSVAAARPRPRRPRARRRSRSCSHPARPAGCRRSARRSAPRTASRSTTHDTPAAIVIDSRDDDLEQPVQEQRGTTRIIVVHTGHPSEQPMAALGAARPRRRHLPRTGVAPRARRPRQGVDPLVGCLPTLPPARLTISGRLDRSVALTVAQTLDALVEAELVDRRRGDLGDDRHAGRDVDADPVAEEISPPHATPPDVARAPSGCARCRLTECGWIAT